MLNPNENPILVSLQWEDPGLGSFWFKKIPQGLVRTSTLSQNQGMQKPQQAYVLIRIFYQCNTEQIFIINSAAVPRIVTRL